MNVSVYKDDELTMYMTDGVLDRQSGPACIRTGHSQEWYRGGKLHRDDGPARIFIQTNVCEWWIDGRYIQAGMVTDRDIFNSYLEK